ncbi:hypothetical protein KKC91_12130 [bacterium]|nr:hypothetical protein [bacterium]
MDTKAKAKEIEELVLEFDMARMFLAEEEEEEEASIVVSLKDITDRKKAEKALQENKEFNRVLFDYNPIETIVVDREGRIIDFNLAKKNSGDRLPNIGDGMYKDYAAHYEIDMYAELMKCIKTGKGREFHEQKYKNRFLSITIAPFPKGAIITSLDITGHKEWTEKEKKKSYRIAKGL